MTEVAKKLLQYCCMSVFCSITLSASSLEIINRVSFIFEKAAILMGSGTGRILQRWNQGFSWKRGFQNTAE